MEHGNRTGGEQRYLGEKEADKIEDRGKRGEEVPDFADLYGQENVRRAAEIAVAEGIICLWSDTRKRERQ